MEVDSPPLQYGHGAGFLLEFCQHASWSSVWITAPPPMDNDEANRPSVFRSLAKQYVNTECFADLFVIAVRTNFYCVQLETFPHSGTTNGPRGPPFSQLGEIVANNSVTKDMKRNAFLSPPPDRRRIEIPFASDTRAGDQFVFNL